MKYRIPSNSILAAGGYLVFTEAHFNAAPGSSNSFAFASTGDEIWLFSGDARTNLTGYAYGVRFGAAPNGGTFGRYTNSAGEELFLFEQANTMGTSNTAPLIGPVVINEIQYHPALGGDEFIELRNITTNTIPLFDVARPTNTWRLSGVNYSFPPGLSLAPNAYLILSRIDPTSFRTKYGVPASVQILGPIPGLLQNNGERLELQRPDEPNVDVIPYITVDSVRYDNHAPWPITADGTGLSLQRRLSSAIGEDAGNWYASPITAGRDNAFNPLVRIETAKATGQIVFSWPADVTGFALESVASLGSTNWVPVSGVVSNHAVLLPGIGTRFFRLRAM